MHYTYVLRSKRDKKLYYGVTSDLRRRFWQHCFGLNKSTRFRRPLQLIYYEAYLHIDDAKAREVFLKSGRGREILKKHLTSYFRNYGGCSSAG